ncbi:SprT family zinc-dependent metalloprotease [Salmonella enterica]|nr:SprT family zinc-dependent metalloprotease [Salmonella enterica]
MQPTVQAYKEIQDAFDYFNVALFSGAIPACLITLQRSKRTYGYFSSKRFIKSDGSEAIDEIALNPSYFAVVPLVEIMQTLVHEMVHAWQFHYGKAGRRGYHNKQWAAKMEAVGLMPSNTGRIGGKKTGEKMSDYPIEDGAFLVAFNQLLTDKRFLISWFDRFPAHQTAAEIQSLLTDEQLNGAQWESLQ